MSLDERRFEELMAYHCAPVLKKLKVANMFHIEKDAFYDILTLLQIYNFKLNKKGLYIRLLQTDQPRITVYVYQRDSLTSLVKHIEIKEFLRQFHYPSNSLEHMLHHLDCRLSTCSGYPHEIGIFLGYPLCDVIGFMRHKPCQYCGYWKVYHNVSKACSLFRSYDLCSREIVHDIQRGKCIEQLVV